MLEKNQESLLKERMTYYYEKQFNKITRVEGRCK